MRRLLGAAAVILVADQLTKFLIRTVIAPGGRIAIAGDGLGIVHLTNTGAAFGMLNGWNITLMAIAILAAAAIIIWHKNLAPRKGGDLLCGVILGGVLGNLVDRLALGAVTDFIQVSAWPPFNIADSALTLGVIVLLYESFRKGK